MHACALALRDMLLIFCQLIGLSDPEHIFTSFQNFMVQVGDSVFHMRKTNIQFQLKQRFV